MTRNLLGAALRIALLGSLPLLVGASPAPDSAAVQNPASGPAGTCAAIVGANFGDGVGITSATPIPAAAPGTVSNRFGGVEKSGFPAYCKVEGMINRRIGAGGKPYGIGFELNLPDAWNGRFLLQGGGGSNGVVRPAFGTDAAGDVPALARGFAVLSHDGGHEAPAFNSEFRADQRAALDFAESAVPTATIVGKRITEAHYGRPIGHSYMAGCSTGGRESMQAFQRFPEMFDGIVAGAPAMATGYSNLGMAYAKVQYNQAAPRDDAGLPMPDKTFSAADRKTILSGLLQQCDALDGLADGMIMNVAQCHFRPAKLQCSGAKKDGCLSPAQVGALDRAFAGPMDATGHPVYSSVPFDTGIVDTSGPISGYITNGLPDIFGPPSRDLTMDVDARARALRADGMQRLIDTDAWTNGSTFLGHGGKILFYHGVSDPWFSANFTWDYWQRARDANGAQAWDNASRFYMIPGMSHCRGGNAYDDFDLLGQVVDWVEKGKLPDPVAHRSSDPGDQRPLCPHPAYPRYIGGDPRKASSFTCTAPQAAASGSAS